MMQCRCLPDQIGRTGPIRPAATVPQDRESLRCAFVAIERDRAPIKTAICRFRWKASWSGSTGRLSGMCAASFRGRDASYLAPPRSVMNSRRFIRSLRRRGRNPSEIVRPIAFAVLRLMTRSSFPRLFHREIGGLGSSEDLVHIVSGAPKICMQIAPIAHKPAGFDVRARDKHGRQPGFNRQDQAALGEEHRLPKHNYAINVLACHRLECRVEIGGQPGLHRNKIDRACRRCILDRLSSDHVPLKCRIEQHAHFDRPG
jgi:hypothetical protein